jgi:hypothetical protein
MLGESIHHHPGGIAVLELLVGIEATRRITEQRVAMEPGRRRPEPERRSRAAAIRAFVSGAVVALASPAPRAAARSRPPREVSPEPTVRQRPAA